MSSLEKVNSCFSDCLGRKIFLFMLYTCLTATLRYIFSFLFSFEIRNFTVNVYYSIRQYKSYEMVSVAGKHELSFLIIN